MGFGSNLKKIRQDKNLTQEELAKKINTSRSNIANYENDKNMPSVEMLEKLSTSLDCSIDYLMGLTSHINPKEDLEKDLYKFDLTEKEYYDAINCFMSDTIQGLSFVLLFPDENISKTKEYKVLLTILSYVSDYIANISLPNDKTSIKPSIRDKFQQELEKAYRPAKKLLLSLDKNKIIHNYNDITKKETKYYMCPVYGRISAGQPNWAEECIEGRIPIDPDLMNITEPEECFFLRVNGESMNKEIKNGAYALIRKTDVVENGDIAVVLVNGYDATLKKFSKQGDLIILEPMSTDTSFTTQVYGKGTEIKIIGKYIGKMEMK